MLSDLVADSDDEMSALTFGTGFTGISDIETGPDGNLYILTFDREMDGQGGLYRIMPAGKEILLLVRFLLPLLLLLSRLLLMERMEVILKNKIYQNRMMQMKMMRVMGKIRMRMRMNNNNNNYQSNIL